MVKRVVAVTASAAVDLVESICDPGLVRFLLFMKVKWNNMVKW
jgi:hypothetical protein